MNFKPISLKRLGYPDWFLKDALNSARSNPFRSNPRLPANENEINSNVKVLSVPFNKTTSKLTSSLSLDKGNKMKIAHGFPNSIGRNLVNVYQRSSQNAIPGVYKIPCKDCNKVYVGQTGREIDIRVNEHKRSVRYAQESSAIFKHVEYGHCIDWDDTSMLYKSNCHITRKIIESLYINSMPNFNLSSGQWSLDLTLDRVIKRIIPGLPPEGTTDHVT